MSPKKRQKLHLSLSFLFKKNKGWKKQQEKIRFKRLGRKWLLVFGFWFLVFGLFFSYRSFRFLTQPLVQEKGSSMLSPRWNGKTQLNFLIFVSNALDNYNISHASIMDIVVVTFNPTEGTLRFLTIPAQTFVETEKGKYPVGKIFALGATLNPPAETDLLTKSVQSFLAMPLDGYVSLRSSSNLIRQPADQNSKLEEKINRLYNDFSSPKFFLQIPQIFQFIKTNLKTNLSAGQLIRLLSQARKIRFDKLQVWDIPGYILSSKRLDSGEEVMIVEQALFDRFISELFIEPEIASERLKVSVKNGTKQAGLATRVSRIFENLGIEVIEVGNADRQDYEQTQILDYSGIPLSRTVQRLEDVFEVRSEQIEVNEARRMDVEVIVGEGFAQ